MTGRHQASGDELSNLLERVQQLKDRSANARLEGDEFLQTTGDEAAAAAKFKRANDVLGQALYTCRSYQYFNRMFDPESGLPIPSGKASNYALKGGEATLAKHVADIYGRRGGLLRRLNRIEDAIASYRLGAQLEARGLDLGFENTYCTGNSIVTQIETENRRASRSENPPPDLQTELAEALEVVRSQIEDGGRKNDAWAWADRVMLTTLLGHEGWQRAAMKHISIYAGLAQVWVMESSVRVFRSVGAHLKNMDDPGFERMAWTIEKIISDARDKGKIVA
jgi:hypothetical protein